MATSDQIALVHRNIDEPTEDNYTDAYIQSLIDASGVNGASAIIWEQKSAGLVGKVNVTEAGASHSFSDLHKNALNMAKEFRNAQVADDAAIVTGNAGRVHVRKIVRT